MALRVAAALRLADHIAAGVTTIQVPAERSGTDATARLQPGGTCQAKRQLGQLPRFRVPARSLS